MTQTEPERAGTASLLFCGKDIQVKKRDEFFSSVFEKIFVEWEDGTLSFDVNIQLLQTDPHTIS